MVARVPLKPSAPFTEIRADAGDWDRAGPALTGAMLAQMHLIRAFEEEVLLLAGEGNVHGPAHSSIGQEAAAVGSIIGLRASDQVNGSHRGHHQFLAKTLGFVAPGLTPEALVKATPERVDALLYRALAEIMGLEPGFGRGRGGSMHLRWGEAGAIGTNAIVGGGVPLAAGAAMAMRLAGTGDCAVTYFGDGAMNIGAALETLNLAAAWRLPLVFFCENNLYAVATHIAETTREARLGARGIGFGIPSYRVDGMDPLAVHLAMQEATALARSGEGPVLIEAECYRYFHQNGPLPGSAFGYRTKEEEVLWRARDPLEQVAREMVARGTLSADLAEALRSKARGLMSEIAGRLTRPEGNRRIVRAELWPDPAIVDDGLRAPLPAAVEQEDWRGATTERKFVDAIADVYHRRFAMDDRLIAMGEDIHRLKGGTNGATRGLAEAFPGRVLGTPISEAGFCALAGGLAMDGRYRPVVEFMYPDFLWVAADAVFNQIGKARHMFGQDVDVPMILRSKIAMGTGYGSQHSLDPAGVFATSAGWRIIAPSSAHDYIGLVNAALKGRDPVLVIEHVDLYQRMERIPDAPLDFTIPLGRARIVRPGREMTILTYSAMVHRSLEAVTAAGVDAEIIDLRTLDRASLDWETIGDSIRRTNNVLIVEQGARGTSYGAMLADEVQRRLMDWLDQPIERVTGREASPTISKVLERAAFAGAREVGHGLAAVMAGKGRPIDTGFIGRLT